MAEVATIGTVLTALAAGGTAAATTMQAKEAGKARKAAAPAPTPQPAAQMPDPEDPRVREERERKMRERALAGGRESTNMTPTGSGGDYTGTVLGG